MDFLSYLEKTSHLPVQTCHLMAHSQRTASKLSSTTELSGCGRRHAGAQAARSQHLTHCTGSFALPQGTREPEVRTGCRNPSLCTALLRTLLSLPQPFPNGSAFGKLGLWQAFCFESQSKGSQTEKRSLLTKPQRAVWQRPA